MRTRPPARSPRRRRIIGTCLLVPALALAACGDDDDREVSSAESPAEPDAGEHLAGTEELADTDAGDEGTDSDTSDVCAAIPADEVATAAGAEIVDAYPTRTDAGYQDIDWWGVGCRYVDADGGDIDIARMLDDAGDPVPRTVLDDLRAESESRTMFDEDSPHAEVPDLGRSAIFLSGLMGSSHDLVIDTGSYLLFIGTGFGIDVDRDELLAVAALALERLG